MKILTVKNKKHEKFLREKTVPFDLSKEDKKKLRDLIKEMRKTMHQANGIGLSANQVGVNKQLFVAQIPTEDGKQKFYAILNPKITKRSAEKSIAEEGCLSIPGVQGTVERPEKITIEGYTIGGKKIKINAWGILARVFQHEIDHLNGELFIDKAKEVYEIGNDK